MKLMVTECVEYYK